MTVMVRIVGPLQREEFITEPAEAMRRGRRLDALLGSALPRRPRGVLRARHEVLNQLDDERQTSIARRLNPAVARPAGRAGAASEAGADAAG
jgi:hypothetical protein